MACLYYDQKNKKYYNSVQEMIADFYKDHLKLPLRNAAIFSADEIQSSTVKKILSVKNINAYEKLPDTTEVTKFIVTPNPGIFSQTKALKDNDRLAPEYNSQEWIYHYILEKLPQIGRVSAKGLTYSEKNLRYLKEKPEFLGDEAEFNDKLIFLLNEAEGIIDLQTKTTEFGSLLHKLISLRFRDEMDEYKQVFSKFFNNEKNKEIFGAYSYKDWKLKIDTIIKTIVDKVEKHGKPITEIFLTSDSKQLAVVKGKIDLIAVDTAGDAHIFEIKISKKPYKDWDKSKLLTLDWQLALYRQLLGQHVNTVNTRLYVIPIQFSDLGNPNNVYLQDFIDRETEKQSGLGPTGKLTYGANELIKNGIHVDYDPKRENDIKDQLNILLKDFEIRTSVEDSSVEKIMESARRRYARDKVWRKYNDYSDIEGIDRGYMTGETEEELREKVEKYVARVKMDINRNVSVLRSAMVSAIKSDQPIKTSAHNVQRDLRANHLLKEYLNEDWEVLGDIPEAIPMGIIVMRNKKSGTINLMSITANQLYAKSDIEGKTYGDLEYIKTLLFVNALRKELLPSSADKIGEIVVFNPSDSGNPVYYKPTRQAYEEFATMIGSTSIRKNITENHFWPIENVALNNLRTMLQSYEGKDVEDIQNLFNLFKNTDLEEIDLQKLITLQKEYYAKYPEYLEKSLETNINFGDNKEILFAILQTAILAKGQLQFANDFQDLSKHSLQFSDYKSLIVALYSKDQAEYDKIGRRIQGIAQGLAWTTPDWVRSKDLRNINKIMSSGNHEIRRRMLKIHEDLALTTKDFYIKINFSGLERTWTEKDQSVHLNLWKNDGSKVSAEFRTKNPYENNLENQLSDAERAYLQKMLFYINIYKLELSDIEIKGLDFTNLESLKKNTRIKDAIENGTYFDLPLVRREGLSKYEDLLTTSQVWDRIQSFGDEITDMIDPRGLTQKDINVASLKQTGFYEMYDAYGRQSPEHKAKLIEKNGVGYFEWNIDTIAHRLVFNKIRKGIFDRRLPLINAYLWWMKLMGGKQNKDISDQLDYVSKQMKLAISDEPIVGGEFRDAAIVTSAVKKISTAAMLSFRPILFAKEMTIGAFKGAMLAATQVYGEQQFGFNHLLSAYEKLFTVDKQFSQEFNLIDKLNTTYGIANMDVNMLAQKLQTDRRGIFRGLGRLMYASNTLPDFYNRLSLFLAKMIADGSYEAHKLVDGKLVYDPRDDKRFSHYFANRDKYKNEKGEYTSAPNDANFNYQRNHYLAIMAQINAERAIDNLKLKENDLIDAAYAEKERSSFKTFTDMAYGYYDRDSQSQLTNTLFGMVFFQFMQFWPGKMKMWFAKPLAEGEEGPMGKYEQAYRVRDGKKILLWRRTTINDDGSVTVENDIEEDTGDPMVSWVGNQYEGLAYSVFSTIRDIAKLDFSAVKDDKARLHRVMFALGDGIMMFVMLGIFLAILKAIIAEKGTDGIDGELLKFADALTTKVYRESNVFNNTLGAVSTEPVAVSWITRVYQDLNSAMEGNKTIDEVLGRNVGALEFLK